MFDCTRRLDWVSPAENGPLGTPPASGSDITAEAPAAHKETAHYATWRDTVAEMMAEPRSSVKFAPAFPTSEAGWACDTADE